MYLQSIKVRPMDKEIEFSYPKMISKDKVEFMTMKVDGVDSSKYYISDSESRISLRKSIFSMNNRKFKIKPIAQRNKDKNNELKFMFWIEVYEIIDNKEKILTKINCPLSINDKNIVNNVLNNGTKETKKKIESIANLEVCFWHSDYKSKNADLFNEVSMCFSPEINEFNSHECWDNKTYLDSLYLENILEYAISQKYGFKNLFKSMNLSDSIKSSKYRFNVKDILNHMNKLDNAICKFTLGSIVLEK